MKVVIYTGVSNKYDKLKAPDCKQTGIDYICFTDDLNIESKGWELRHIPNLERIDKVVKIMPHIFLHDYDVSIWVDASMCIKKPIVKLLDYVKDKNIAIPLHPRRRKLKEEFEICIKAKKADPDELLKQKRAYSKFLKENVYQCGVMVRRHNELDVLRTMEDWWMELQMFTFRDQLSFPIVSLRNKLSINVIDTIILPNLINPYVILYKHERA